MLKDLIRGISFAAWLCCAAASGAAAQDDAASPSDDEYYCRFEREGVVGDVAHVEAFTGVGASVCQTAESYVYCFFSWRDGVGVVLEFGRETGNASSIRSFGFWPTVNTSDCRSVYPDDEVRGQLP